jgi:hypothetical protein
VSSWFGQEGNDLGAVHSTGHFMPLLTTDRPVFFLADLLSVGFVPVGDIVNESRFSFFFRTHAVKKGLTIMPFE